MTFLQDNWKIIDHVLVQSHCFWQCWSDFLLPCLVWCQSRKKKCLDIIPGYQWLKCGAGKRSSKHQNIIGNVAKMEKIVFTEILLHTALYVVGILCKVVWRWRWWTQSIAEWSAEFCEWSHVTGNIRREGLPSILMLCHSRTWPLPYVNIQHHLKNIHLKGCLIITLLYIFTPKY